jgi:hypothetical protein
MITTEQITRIEQQILTEISDALCVEGISLYQDRDEYGRTAFLVCRDTRKAREIIEDTPALIEERGASLIVTVRHPERDERADEGERA